MAIDRKALFAKLDGKKSKAPADDSTPVEGADDEMSPGEMLLKAIDEKDPEAIEEAIKACVSDSKDEQDAE
jgi:hypothetical protein